MNRLEKLPEITEKALGGLTADESLKYRILKSAAESKPAGERSFLRPVFGLLCATAVMVFVLLALGGRPGLDPSPTEAPVLRSFTAGGGPLQAEAFPATLTAGKAVSADIASLGTIEDEKNLGLITEALAEAEPAPLPDGASSDPGLVLRLADGSEFSFALSDPYLISGSSAWTCPRFFEIISQLK